MFEIHMGVPEMEEFWNALTEKVSLRKASTSEVKLYGYLYVAQKEQHRNKSAV